jgi:hypothetical protein
MRGKAHSDETRATVTAALLAGQGVADVARVYKLPETTVRRIRDEIAPELLAEVGEKKRATIGALIEDHLRTSLESATMIARKAAENDAWLRQQTASDVAVLYGVMTDKAVRILEAIEPADDEADDDDDE